MTSGTAEGCIIRKARREDLESIKHIADQHRHELGFVRTPALSESIQRAEIIVAETNKRIIGFVEFHHRQDVQTTLYHIAVGLEHRQRGIGRQMIKALVDEARGYSKHFIQLKCPMDLEANVFYARLGFFSVAIAPGTRRNLRTWRLTID